MPVPTYLPSVWHADNAPELPPHQRPPHQRPPVLPLQSPPMLPKSPPPGPPPPSPRSPFRVAYETATPFLQLWVHWLVTHRPARAWARCADAAEDAYRFDPSTMTVSIHLQQWIPGSVILVVHDMADDNCELWLSLRSSQIASSRSASLDGPDVLAFIPTGVDVSHAQLVAQSQTHFYSPAS